MDTPTPLYQDLSVSVIAINGLSGTGKGTARGQVATRLGFHQLDSGCLYRAVAYKALKRSVAITDVPRLVRIASELDLQMDGLAVYSGDEEITDLLRTEQIDNHSRVVSQVLEVRRALMQYQLSMRKLPGLVADGRDMSDVFTGQLRFGYHFTTDVEVKAERRVRWYEKRGVKVDPKKVLQDMKDRDRADMTREHSPFKQHPDDVVVDNTNMKVGEAAEFVVADYLRRLAAVA